MMLKLTHITFVLAFAFALWGCFQTSYSDTRDHAADHDIDIIEKAPDIGLAYRAINEVRAVNALRALGKERAIRIMRDARDFHPDTNDRKVHLLCRLLFVNPKGWTPPALGAPGRNVRTEHISDWPVFPLALSNRVPFLLVTGYELGGFPEPAIYVLDSCEGFVMINKDLPVTDYDAAEKHLASDPKFSQLYRNPRDVSNMLEFLAAQSSLDIAEKPTSMPFPQISR